MKKVEYPYIKLRKALSYYRKVLSYEQKATRYLLYASFSEIISSERQASWNNRTNSSGISV